MTYTIPKQIQETLEMIARMNVTTSVQSRRISVRKIRTTFTYTQQWKPKTLLTLLAFIRETVPALVFEKDEVLLQYIGDIGRKALTETKETAHVKGVFFYFYFIGSLMLAAIIVVGGNNDDFIPKPIRIIAFIMVMGAALLVWVNRIWFKEIEEHLRNDALTRDDCFYIIEQISQKRYYKNIRYGIAPALIVLAFILVHLSANLNKSYLDKRYSEIRTDFIANIQEIDSLITLRRFDDAWTKTEVYYDEARKIEDAVKKGEHDISDTYLNDCQKKIVCNLVTGFWISHSDNPDFPFQIYYVSDPNEGYWSFMTNQEFSAEELLQIVEENKIRYFIPAESISISKGSTKSVTIYAEDKLKSIEMICENFPEEVISIGEREYTRVK